jgi:hypothetical protein
MRWRIHFPQNADSYSTVTVKYDYGFPIDALRYHFIYCWFSKFSSWSYCHFQNLVIKTPTWQQSICEQWFHWVRLTKCFEAIFMKRYGRYSLKYTQITTMCSMCVFSHVYPTSFVCLFVCLSQMVIWCVSARSSTSWASQAGSGWWASSVSSEFRHRF